MKTFFNIAFSCCFLLGCQHSPKKNYYYLNTATTEQHQIKTSSENMSTLIGIGPIEIADFLQRPQIIDNQTDNTLNVSDNDYWAEPLNKGIARVIALNFAQRNSHRSVVYFPWRSDSKPRYSFRVQVHNLSRNNPYANLIASWELIDNDSKIAIQHRQFNQTIAVGSGANQLAQAYSSLLAELTIEMDNALSKVEP